MRLTAARISQAVFLVCFLVLFFMTEYRGSDVINAAVNAYFRSDPLVAASYLLAVKAFTWLLLPAVLILVATVLLGRFFCGWICPLGTILDIAGGSIARKGPVALLRRPAIRHGLLLCLLTAALFGVNVAGIMDPLAILLRALTFFVNPLAGDLARQGWTGLYKIAGEGRDVVRPAYDFLRDNVLPFRESSYPLSVASMLLLVAIVWLERYDRRNWCRNLCPLGTLLGIAGTMPLLRRLPRRLCADCGDCASLCPTAFDGEIMQESGCIRCMACVDGCTRDRARFSIAQPELKTGHLPSRRALLAGCLSGIALSRSFRFRSPDPAQRCIRPPGVGDEDEFLRKCVRCGECMKVCLRSALYPDTGRSGMAGLFTPVVIARLGYCEYNCTLCGQVCPTGAIPSLPVEVKRKAVIGRAVFDKNHCLPYAKKTNCIVCEEHCPISGKAIRTETVRERDEKGRIVEIKRPYVVDDLCNGCGICEHVCPVTTKAGIEVFPSERRGLQSDNSTVPGYGGPS